MARSNMTNKEIYMDLIEGVNVLIERKVAEKNELEAASIADARYASVLNEIGTLRRVNNDFMLFKN